MQSTTCAATPNYYTYVSFSAPANYYTYVSFSATPNYYTYITILRVFFFTSWWVSGKLDFVHSFWELTHLLTSFSPARALLLVINYILALPSYVQLFTKMNMVAAGVALYQPDEDVSALVYKPSLKPERRK